MVKVIQTFLCWLIRTCRKMSMIACRLFSGFIQIVNKQSCLIWILHKVSETTSNDLFSWSREIGWKCLSFPSFLVFHCIAMCLTVNEKKKTKTCWKYLVTSFFYRSEIEHKKKKVGNAIFLMKLFLSGERLWRNFYLFQCKIYSFWLKKM